MQEQIKKEIDLAVEEELKKVSEGEQPVFDNHSNLDD